MEKFYELAYAEFLQDKNINLFLKHISDYENKISSELQLNGYVRLNSSARTVTFSFGEVTFERSRWYKNGQCYIPVDDYLELDKYSRYSKELLYKIAQIATYVPYRKVVEIIKLTLNLDITKDVVLKAVKLANQLMVEKEDYRYLVDEVVDKREVDTLYLEGDGLFVKASTPDTTQKTNELTHFVVHEGSYQISENRWGLKNKKEIISVSHKQAKEELVNYIYNHYQLTKHTKLITVSDGGLGYSPKFFKELSKGFKIKYHEHFYDMYHVYASIDTMYRHADPLLKQITKEAIQNRDKKLLQDILELVENDIDDDNFKEQFSRFSKKVLRDFKYMVSPVNRGISSAGIGIIESQHRKITYRMKRRGMYWSKSGADCMAKMIIAVYENELRDLFFGEWRDEYEYCRHVEYDTDIHNVYASQSSLPRGTLRLPFWDNKFHVW